MWYVYILQCLDGTFYTGITDDVERRFREHQSGKGGHYTKYAHPQQVLYREFCNTRSEAETREQQIKRWSRAKKIALIKGKKEELRNLSQSRD